MSARKVNMKRLAAMYRAGLTLDEISGKFACCRSAVVDNVKRLPRNVPRRGKGWKPAGYGARMSAALKLRHRRMAS